MSAIKCGSLLELSDAYIRYALVEISSLCYDRWTKSDVCRKMSLAGWDTVAVWKTYRQGSDYSYALGAFPTWELLQHRPEQVLEVLMHPSFVSSETGQAILEQSENVPWQVHIDAKAIARLSPKENCYLIGVFAKYSDALELNASNVLLVQPANAGNVGTIMRSMLGFGVNDLAIIPPAVDCFDPRVVRAAMGAHFRMRFTTYPDYAAYAQHFPQHHLYPFMLQGAVRLQDATLTQPFSLIFGNESTGLDASYAHVGQSVVIEHANTIDSLNVTIAAGIALHHFARAAFEA